MLWSSLTSLWSLVIPIYSYAHTHAHAQHSNIVFHSCSYDVMFWYALWSNHVWCGPQSLLTGPHSSPKSMPASSSAPTPTPTHILAAHSSCTLGIMHCHLDLCAAVCNNSSTTTTTHGQACATPMLHFCHIITLKACNYALPPWLVCCSPQSSINGPQPQPTLTHIYIHQTSAYVHAPVPTVHRI